MLNIRILDRYIIIKYIVTFLTMLALFIPISVLVDLSQKIDNFNQYEINSYINQGFSGPIVNANCGSIESGLHELYFVSIK